MTEFDLFISHAHADNAKTQRIHQALKAAALNAWIDLERLEAGARYTKVIQKAMDVSKAGLLVISRAALQSAQCEGEHLHLLPKFQRGEIQLYVALLESIPFDEFPYYLKAIQYVDLSKDFDATLPKLVEVIERKLIPPTLETIQPIAAPTSGFASARLIKRPDVREAPRKLIGREDALTEIQTLLDDGRRVVVQAHGGAGKTALAGTFAELWMKAHPGEPLLWITAGSADDLLDAVGKAFGQGQAMAAAGAADAAQGDARVDLAYGLMEGVGLVVVDDVWTPPALRVLADAVPKSTALLATSRLRCDLDVIRRLEDLSDTAAMELLQYSANRPTLTHDPEAKALCETLGRMAFAVEIAGKTLQRTGQMAGQLLQSIKDSPHMLQSNDSKPGRENVAALIEASLKTLDDEARNVFLAFGAFFAPRLTAELLAIYLELDSGNIEKILLRLHDGGLVEHLPGTEREISSYRIHDLAYAYAAAQHDNTHRERALHACITYTERYNESSLENFMALLPALDVLLQAAEWAYVHERWAETETFAWNLDSGSEVLSLQGFYTQSLRLLENAAAAAEQQGNQQNQGAHLGNLGIAYRNLGEYARAIDYLERALKIQQSIGDKKGEGNQLGNLGNVYHSLGDYPRAIEYHQQALGISREIGNKSAEGSILGNLGIAYRNLGEYARAIEYYKQSLAIHRQIGDKRGEGNRLGNLGIAYRNLGDYPRAIEYHQQALDISRQIGNKSAEGSILGNLGNAYQSLGEYARAIDYHQQALGISRQIGDKRGEGSILGNLGNAYQSLGEYAHAIEYLEQALEISRQIGDKGMEGSALGNLGNAYESLGEYPRAIEYYKQSLAIHRQIGDRNGEGNDLNNLGAVYEAMEDYEKALDFYQQALAIYAALGLQHRVKLVERNIARVRGKLGE